MVFGEYESSMMRIRLEYRRCSLNKEDWRRCRVFNAHSPIHAFEDVSAMSEEHPVFTGITTTTCIAIQMHGSAVRFILHIQTVEL